MTKRLKTASLWCEASPTPFSVWRFARQAFEYPVSLEWYAFQTVATFSPFSDAEYSARLSNLLQIHMVGKPCQRVECYLTF